MGANPHANGGVLRKELRLPDFRHYGVEVLKLGQIEVSKTLILSEFSSEM